MININPKQKELLLKYLPEAETYLEEDDLYQLQDKLDSKIMEIGFRRDYSLNTEGLKLQLLYDQIYMQNPDDSRSHTEQA